MMRGWARPHSDLFEDVKWEYWGIDVKNMMGPFIWITLAYNQVFKTGRIKFPWD